MNFGAPVLFDDGLVERSGPGLAPTAFRIWASGANMSDEGPDIFSERSATLLLDEQAARGNLYSIDFDHLSLKSERPAEAGRAAGWHRLEVRVDEAGNPELWAVDVEWCADAKAGLEEKPPRWRYFSPAFTVDTDTREVVSYTNTALCINPATWNNNALATRARGQEIAMNDEEKNQLAILNALAAKMSAEGADEAKKQAAAALYAAEGGEEEHNRLRTLAAEGAHDADKAAAEGDEDDDEPKANAESDEDDDGEEEKSRAEGDEAQARAATAVKSATGGASAAARAKDRARPDGDDPYLMRTVKKLAARVDELEKAEKVGREQRRAARVAEILGKRKDLSPELRAQLKGLRPSQVRDIVNAIPMASTAKPAAGVETKTRGKGQGEGTPNVRPSVEAEVDRAMGIRPGPGPNVGFGEAINGRRTFHTREPSKFRAQQRAARKTEIAAALAGGERN